MLPLTARRTVGLAPSAQLPEARQQEIIERLKTASLVEVSRELTIAGLRVSPKVTVRFRAWYFDRLQRRVSQICEVLGELEAIRQHVQGGHTSPLTGEQISNLVPNSRSPPVSSSMATQPAGPGPIACTSSKGNSRSRNAPSP